MIIMIIIVIVIIIMMMMMVIIIPFDLPLIYQKLIKSILHLSLFALSTVASTLRLLIATVSRFSAAMDTLPSSKTLSRRFLSGILGSSMSRST